MLGRDGPLCSFSGVPDVDNYVCFRPIADTGPFREMVGMRSRFLGQGLSLTFLCWTAGALLSLGPILGDCSPDGGRTCPTDRQRDMALVKIILGAAAVNVSGLLVLGYRYGGRGGE